MQGVALFEVHGDRHVIYFDLNAVGLSEINVEESQFTILNEVENELRASLISMGRWQPAMLGLSMMTGQWAGASYLHAYT